MTGCYATDFIKRRHQEINQELNDDFETVTVRLEAKNALMLKAFSQEYQFPVSTSFTDMVSKHLVDVLMSLKDKDFDAIVALFEKTFASEGSALDILRQHGIVPRPRLFDFISTMKDSSEEECGDSE